MPNFNTIAAVSTPRGKGGIATIRISGTDTLNIIQKMFQPKFLHDWTKLTPRYANFGIILGTDDTPTDEGILTFYKAPASFTGEDMAEISCHGGIRVTEEIYLSALAHGAYAAGPGEFTRRAFVNGKLTLTEAEAVGELIDADTKPKMQMAAGALSGNISREINKIYKSLEKTMSALYAAIDYPDEDVGDEGEREIASIITDSLKNIQTLLKTYETGRAVSAGVKCTICGRPNTGKSSLFNAIVGDEAAIVTNIAGTTRDILREHVSFAGVSLNLSDTAGVRHISNDEIELYGIKKAESEIQSAELVLLVIDGSTPLTDEDKSLIQYTHPTQAIKICVINKSDLPNNLTDEDKSLLKSMFNDNIIIASAKSNNITELEKKIQSLYNSDKINLRTDAVIWDPRQREILLHCERSLTLAQKAIQSSDPLDCICTLVEEAMTYLGESDGRTVNESIINEVFKHFCVGK